MSTIRDTILNFARAINRCTHRMDKIKSRFHLTDLAQKVLVRPTTATQAQRITASLDTTTVLQKATNSTHFLIVMTEKMGDALACEPIAEFLKAHNPGCQITWYIRSTFCELFSNNPFIDELVQVSCLSEAMDLAELAHKRDPHAILINCHFDGATCGKTGRCFRNPANPQITAQNYYAIGNLLDTYAYASGLPKINRKPNLFLASGSMPPANLPNGYIVFHTLSDDPNRNWDNRKWHELATALKASGHYIVEIGANKSLANANTDLTGFRSLLEIATVIKNASVFVGIDSGFAHFANALEIPSVILIGKFGNFDIYNPYSGTFSASEKFRILRAPPGSFAREISTRTVVDAINEIFSCPA